MPLFIYSEIFHIFIERNWTMPSLSNSWEIKKTCFLALLIFPSHWYWRWPHFFKNFSQEIQWGRGEQSKTWPVRHWETVVWHVPSESCNFKRKVVASGECQPQLCCAPRQLEESSARWGLTEILRQRWQASPDCLLGSYPLWPWVFTSWRTWALRGEGC